MKTENQLTVATEILNQLGGGKFLAITGAHGLIGSDNSLSMKLRTNTAKATHLKITLGSMDTYKMEFLKCSMRKGEFKRDVIKEYENVYCDMLRDIFTKVTGYYTSL